MHMPWHAPFSAAGWREACKVDVLHCPAISGMLMLLVERLGRWRDAGAFALLLFFVGLQSSAEQWHTGLLMLDQCGMSRTAAGLEEAITEFAQWFVRNVEGAMLIRFAIRTEFAMSSFVSLNLTLK